MLYFNCVMAVIEVAKTSMAMGLFVAPCSGLAEATLSVRIHRLFHPLQRLLLEGYLD